MRHIRSIAALLLALYGAACTSYQALADPPASLQAPPKPFKKARVTVDTGKRFEVMSPRLVGDSIQGSLRNRTAVSVPMSKVQVVEVPWPNDTKTFFLVIGVIVALVGAAFGALAIIVSGG